MFRHLSRFTVGASVALADGGRRFSQCEAPPAPAEPSPAAWPADLVLKQVQVVFRHGARTPLTDRYWPDLGYQWDDCGSYRQTVQLLLRDLADGPPPKSDWDERQVSTKLPGGCSKGELTVQGQKQAFEFGQQLRQRYVDTMQFLPPQYQEGVLKARSTNFSRTVATTRGVLTGLYPDPAPGAPPVTVSTSAVVDEVLYPDWSNCQKFGAMVKRRVAELEQRGAAESAVLAARVRDALGLPLDHAVDFVGLHDVLSCAEFHGKALPPGVTPALLEEINRKATELVRHKVAPTADDGAHHEILQLGIGVLVEMVMAAMEVSHQGGASEPKLRLWSGHDTTLFPMLAALGVHVDDWPPYLSNIIFELWEGPAAGGSAGPRAHYVRVLYNDREVVIPGMQKGELCELSTFKQHVLPYRIPERERAHQCTLLFTHEESQPHAVDARTGKAIDGM